MKMYINNFLSYQKVEKLSSTLTINDYRKELEKFIDYMDKNNITNIHQITTSIIRQYFYFIKDKRNLGQSSISKIIAIIKSFFNFLETEEIILKNPTRVIKVPKKISRAPEVISKYEIDLLLNSIKFSPARQRKNYIRDNLIISILYYTGIRKSELLSLNWNDINLGKNILTVKSGKGKKDRIIPLHKNVTEFLDKYLTLRLPLKCNALFIGENGKRLCKCSFNNILKTYLKIAGLANKGYSAHSFRHSFATQLIENGVDIFKVQKLLGHASLDATKVYINFHNTNLIKAISTL